MSAPLKSRHVRLTDEADRVLMALAALQEKDAAEMARLILEEALLGRAHTLRLIVQRHRRVGFTGTDRD